MPADIIRFADLQSGKSGGAGYEQVARLVEDGAVFVYPTETIYGLGGRGDSQEVKERIRRIKRRSPADKLLLVAGSMEQFEKCNLYFPRPAWKLIHALWPGKLTLVLPVKGKPGVSVGIRLSNHPFISALSQYVPAPLFSTSANISGTDYSSDPGTIFSQFCDSVDFIIDAGVLPYSPPSTVVHIRVDETYRILRVGAVPSKEINEILSSP
jgi:L-threonylcarbamoyladenylate synthase